MTRRLLLLVTLAVSCMAIPVGHAEAAPATCNGYADLCSRPFSETVLAGTHNSMAADDYGWNFAITTQTHTMRRQLDAGIRALAIDVHYAAPGFLGGVYNEDGPTRGNIEPYLCHQVCLLGSLKLTTGFNEIAGFMRDNPHEVIAIFVEDYVTPEDLSRSLQASALWPYIYEGPLTRTLGEMIDSGKRVVMISQNKTSGLAWYPKLTAIGRDTTYEFSRTDQLTNPTKLWDSCRPTPWGAAGRGRILVMQHFVTPTTTGSRSASTTVNARSVIEARSLKCQQRHGVMPSLILVDYYELGDVLGAVRKLNDLYVAPVVGCADGAACGIDPGSSDAGASVDPDCATCKHPTTAANASGATVLRRLRLVKTSTRHVRPGQAIRLRISIANRGAAAATVSIDLAASAKRALRLPARVHLRVPARGSASQVFVVRAAKSAQPGAVDVIADVGGLESRLTVQIDPVSAS